jgi:hypothetical protein
MIDWHLHFHLWPALVPDIVALMAWAAYPNLKCLVYHIVLIWFLHSSKCALTQTLLRIACPDGRTLQGAFHPREPLRALLAWLGSLLTPAAAASLVLLLPPSTRIDAGNGNAGSGRSAEQDAVLDKTFAASGLVPAARMTLKCTPGGAELHSLSPVVVHIS